ncbi:TetR/AcrR family transcriptional regulator [Pyxidicoccus fallax]|uniref:TetR/AcrR family transcriptional regulator n=1 Tax=Pyxidicoccus fallax TaxID=394095 RepID=A0A848L9G4_9BACT|nr:TetR/AcrR family transcriptional regulator [Pyxidicoccus fallax]NMO15660.1 TetR/AcrR family transcriptional regulator [Pyxidicoccus fallax]NPC78780.1 TetR/AcrR family transcriptional regulator [Pyxidicoccus fallax]
MSSDPRTAILEAAGEVFGRYGFKKASVEDIARRAGVGKGSIYLHFESKEALFDACARLAHARSLSELQANVHRATTPEAQVRAYIRCKLEQFSRPPAGERMDLVTLVELGAQIPHLLPQMLTDEVAVLTRILEEGVTQGVFNVASSQQVARGFVELLSNLAGRLMTQGLDDQLHQSLDAYFDVFIRGLTSNPSPPRHKR